MGAGITRTAGHMALSIVDSSQAKDAVPPPKTITNVADGSACDIILTRETIIAKSPRCLSE